jgi:hypothetical protein
MNMMDMFKVIIIVQLFYAFSITSLTYAMPDNTLSYVTGFSSSDDWNLETISGEVQDSMQSQINIPVIELGALVFYSGNILIDLILNFLYAVPQMIAMLINGFLILFNVDSYIFATIELFAAVVVTALYIIGLIEILINIRSGRGAGIV